MMILIIMPKSEFDEWIIQARQRVHNLRDRVNHLTLQKALAEKRGEPTYEFDVKIADDNLNISIMQPLLQGFKARARRIVDWQEPPEVVVTAPSEVSVTIVKNED